MSPKRYAAFLILLSFTFSLGYVFFLQNERNYLQYKKGELYIVHHPELIPNAKTSQIISFGFTNILSDFYWLRTIQYIGGNAVSGEYKKYLAAMMNLITDLNPYFESPYSIGLLLIPSSAEAYDDTKNPENFKDYADAEALGLKGIKNFCDEEKINLIEKQDNLGEIIGDSMYKNPCKSYKIPYYLAYVYYFYLHKNLEAAKYYKIVSAQDDAPEGAKVLAAIMQGKGGDREKSIYMFLSLALSTDSKDENCKILTQEVQNAYSYISQSQSSLNGNFIQSLEQSSKLVLPKLSMKNESKILSDAECTNFLAKAIREINLLYLDTANEAFIQEQGKSSETPEELLKQGYINFIPTDFQRYSDDEYGIIYKYSDEIQRYDYEMGYVGLPK